MSPKVSRLQSLKSLVRRLLPKSRFARGVAVLGGGTAAANLIVVVGSPVVTRLYTPEDYGLLGVFTSLLMVSLVLASWRYDVAIPVPPDDQTAADILTLCWAIIPCMAVVAAILAWLIGDQVAIWLGQPALGRYLWLVSAGMLVGGVYESLYYWAVRKKAFSVIAQTKVYQSVGLLTTQVGLGLLGLCPWGLLLGGIVRQSAGTARLAKLVLRGGVSFRLRFSLGTILSTAKRYYRFPVFSSWASLLNTLSAQVPVLFLSAFYGGSITGQYALCHQVAWYPTSLIGRAVSQVFFSTVSESRAKGTTAAVTLAVFSKLVQVAVPCVLIVGLIAPELFTVVFGQNWKDAGVVAQYLCPWILCVFITMPLSSIVFVLERQHGELVFQTVLLIGRVTALWLGGQWASPLIAISAFATTSAVIWFVYMLWLHKAAGNRPAVVVGRIGAELLRSLPMVAPCAIGRFVFGGAAFVAGGALVSAVWVGVSLFTRLRHGGGQHE